jgi:hypothetical protein
MESEQIDPDWVGYACKSGQILFYYNKTTGEHRWPCDIYDVSLSLALLFFMYMYEKLLQNIKMDLKFIKD